MTDAEWAKLCLAPMTSSFSPESSARCVFPFSRSLTHLLNSYNSAKNSVKELNDHLVWDRQAALARIHGETARNLSWVPLELGAVTKEARKITGFCGCGRPAICWTEVSLPRQKSDKHGNIKYDHFFVHTSTTGETDVYDSVKKAIRAAASFHISL